MCILSIQLIWLSFLISWTNIFVGERHVCRFATTNDENAFLLFQPSKSVFARSGDALLGLQPDAQIRPIDGIRLKRGRARRMGFGQPAFVIGGGAIPGDDDGGGSGAVVGGCDAILSQRRRRGAGFVVDGIVIERILTQKEEVGLKGLRLSDGGSAPLLGTVNGTHFRHRRRFEEEKTPENPRNRRPKADEGVESEESEDAAENWQNDAEESAELVRAERRRRHSSC